MILKVDLRQEKKERRIRFAASQLRLILSGCKQQKRANGAGALLGKAFDTEQREPMSRRG